MVKTNTQNVPQFTRRQHYWLEDVFFENLSEDATFEALLRTQGKRIVIAKVRELVDRAEKKGVI